MGYDEVLTHLGDFGKYQKRIYVLLCLPAISCAFHKLAGVFLLAKPLHRCLMPFEDAANASYASLTANYLNMSYPAESTADGDRWSMCNRYDTEFTDEYFSGGTPANKTIGCDRWLFDRSTFSDSAVIEWNMVCGRSFFAATSDSLFMVGVLLGSIGFGALSDRLGRKPVFFTSLVLQVLFGILAGIAPEYYTYTISRIIIGATTSGVFLVAYVIAMEMVGPKYRLYAGVICMMFFSVGYMLTALFAYFIKGWRSLQIALTLPGLLFLTYWWIIPESTRWLLSKNRVDEARTLIERAAHVNGVKMPATVMDNLVEAPSPATANRKQATLFDLVRNPNLRSRSLLIFFDWFVNSGTYYSLSWNTNNLGQNVLLNFVISGAVEIPAYCFLLLTLNRWGRKMILCGCMLLAGTTLLLTMFMGDHKWLLVTCAMIGKLAITASYGTIYIFSAEQFPTSIRNVALGVSSMFARIGGILAPFFNMLAIIWTPLPMLVFGALAFSGGLLSMLLPETLDQNLPETIESAVTKVSGQWPDEEMANILGETADRNKVTNGKLMDN